MISIQVRDDEALEKAINRFKKSVIKEGVIAEVKNRKYFVKPSLTKHIQNKKLKRKMALKKNKAVKDY